MGSLDGARRHARHPGRRLDGTVRADSEEDLSRMDNHSGRPEIREALERGSGHAVRYSATAGHDFLYSAMRRQTADGTSMVIRFSLPLHRLDEALTQFRSGLWIAFADHPGRSRRGFPAFLQSPIEAD